MRRTWFWTLCLTLTPAAALAQYGAPLQPQPAPTPAPATAAPAPATAAPVAAPPPVGGEGYAGGGAVAVDTGLAAPAGERKGLQFAARLILNDIQALSLDGSLDHLPRIYGGYHMGKLAITLGLNFTNTSGTVGSTALAQGVARAGLSWVAAPGATYELLASMTGNLTLDLFGNILYGQGAVSSEASADAGGAAEEWTYSTLGIDLGARVSHWFSPGFGAGFDLGLAYGKTTGEHAGNDEAGIGDLDKESDSQTIAIYGAIQLTGLFLP